MAYGIVCIGSRVNSEEAMDRAIRLLNVIHNNSDAFGPNRVRSAVRLYHTGNPFELRVAQKACHLFGRDSVKETHMAFNEYHDMSWWVRQVHPRPRKLTKKSFGDLCTVAYALTYGHVLMAAPYRKDRGRAHIALRLATRNYMPSIDLSSDEAEELIAAKERVIAKGAAHLTHGAEFRQLLDERRMQEMAQAAEEFELDFEEYLRIEYPRVFENENIREYVCDRALTKFRRGQIKSPEIRTMEILERRDGEIYIGYMKFQDEWNTMRRYEEQAMRREERRRRRPRRERPMRAQQVRRSARVRAIDEVVEVADEAVEVEYDGMPDWAEPRIRVVRRRIGNRLAELVAPPRGFPREEE